jgi:hypothetical protein
MKHPQLVAANRAYMYQQSMPLDLDVAMCHIRAAFGPSRYRMAIQGAECTHERSGRTSRSR